MNDLGSLGYFLGMQAHRDAFGLHLQQSKYIMDLLHRAEMIGAKTYSIHVFLDPNSKHGDPLSKFDTAKFRQIVGVLQYCTLTRPYIAYYVNQLLHSPFSVH